MDNRIFAPSVKAVALSGATSFPPGDFPSNNQQFMVETGGLLSRPEEIGDLVVTVFHQRPVYLRDIAIIADGAEEPSDYVFMGFGP